MELLPKNIILRITGLYIIISIPLILLMKLISSWGNHYSEKTSDLEYAGNWLAVLIGALVFALVLRTNSVFSGRKKRDDFNPISKLTYYSGVFIMLLAFLALTSVIFATYKLMNSDRYSIIVCLLFAIYPFHLLGLIFYLKDNNLIGSPKMGNDK
jgi:hypothetical protein